MTELLSMDDFPELLETCYEWFLEEGNYTDHPVNRYAYYVAFLELMKNDLDLVSVFRDEVRDFVTKQRNDCSMKHQLMKDPN